MDRYTKDRETSSTVQNNPQNCAGCPRVAVPENGTTAPREDRAIAELLKQTLVDMNTLQVDIMRVEKEQDKTRSFYKTIARLGNISQVAIIALMIVPLIQLIGCLAIIYYLGLQENLSGLFQFAIGGIGLLSLIEVLFAYGKISSIEKQLEKHESRLDKIEEKGNS